MSGIDSLLERLRRSYAAIAEVEATVSQFPNDRWVRASLDALKRDAAQLEALWETECAKSSVEICRYRLIPESQEVYSLASVSKSLLNFQELFSQIFNALKNGAKKRARRSDDLIAETSFNFGFSYPGSLGIALTAESERNLFGSNFDKAVAAFLQVLELEDEDDVKDIASNLGDAVVRKVYDWSKVNYNSGYGINIIWNDSRGNKSGGQIDHRSLGNIVSIIERTSDIEQNDFTTSGVLVAIDALKKRFRLVEPNGFDYSGRLGESFQFQHQWTVNKSYVAHIHVDSVMEYATQELHETFKLLSLTPIDEK